MEEDDSTMRMKSLGVRKVTGLGKKEGAGRGDRETEREVLADHTRAPGTLQVQFQTTAIERTSQQSRSHRCFGFPVHARVM